MIHDLSVYDEKFILYLKFLEAEIQRLQDNSYYKKLRQREYEVCSNFYEAIYDYVSILKEEIKRNAPKKKPDNDKLFSHCYDYPI